MPKKNSFDNFFSYGRKFFQTQKNIFVWEKNSLREKNIQKGKFDYIFTKENSFALAI